MFAMWEMSATATSSFSVGNSLDRREDTTAGLVARTASEAVRAVRIVDNSDTSTSMVLVLLAVLLLLVLVSTSKAIRSSSNTLAYDSNF
jgi:hypothetical protein